MGELGINRVLRVWPRLKFCGPGWQRWNSLSLPRPARDPARSRRGNAPWRLEDKPLHPFSPVESGFASQLLADHGSRHGGIRNPAAVLDGEIGYIAKIEQGRRVRTAPDVEVVEPDILDLREHKCWARLGPHVVDLHLADLDRPRVADEASV